MTDEEPVENSRGKLDFFVAELDRQEQDFSARSTSMNARASLLVAASSIAAGLQATSLDAWAVLAGLVAGTSAVLGVVALWPRSGHLIDIEAIEHDTIAMSDYEALRYIAYGRLRIMRADESSLRRRASLVKIGFAFLAAAAVLTGLHLLFAAIPWPPAAIH